MLSGHVNLLAVLVAAIINMAVGALWFSPAMFSKQWAKLTGGKESDMRANANMGYAVSAVGALVESWVLAHLVYGLSLADGLKWAFWIWLAFVAVTLAVGTVFEGRPWKLWAINVGYFLVVLLIQGALLARWI